MFIAMSRFTVSNGLEKEVRTAFSRRPHRVDGVPGFRRMEVLQPVENPKEFWLMTWWDDEASFNAWHSSPDYHESHQGIPKGLKLMPGSTEIRRFERIAE